LTLPLLALAIAPATAQSLQVYSEFSRPDPFGRIVAVDRARRPEVHPREILSPALARNAYTSFHIAVTVPPGRSFTLYVGENPEGAFQITVYREVCSLRGGSWIPDALEPVKLPYTAILPDPARPIAGQTTIAFWMDLWTPGKQRLARFKVEPQIYFEGRWISYPMEVRTVAAVIPLSLPRAVRLTAIGEPADAAARGLLLEYLCGTRAGPTQAGARNIRRLIARNALQDMALAKALENKYGRDSLFWPISELTGATDPAGWCLQPVFPSDRGAEWYLKVRDTLYRMVD
jgi:hypothetical protein